MMHVTASLAPLISSRRSDKALAPVYVFATGIDVTG
ncbi:MAG: hypothetical protein ACI8PT_002429 [Gammaproteobacteria bacterium]|jgi:hypothetical protein